MKNKMITIFSSVFGRWLAALPCLRRIWSEQRSALPRVKGKRLK